MLRFAWVLMIAATVTEAGGLCGGYPSGHTMCLPPRSTRCGSAKLRCSLSEKDKEHILHRHNLLRNKVAAGKERRGSPGPQPGATDMALMTWDDELAATAQRWADQLNFAHDTSRNAVDGTRVGQNIQIQCSSKKLKTPINYDWKNEIGQWYDEVKDMPAPNSGESPLLTHAVWNRGKVIGHYTQMVWAKTKKVGCGVRTTKKGESVKNWWSSSDLSCRLVVCNYKVGGNVMDENVYAATGKRCANRDTRYPFLCL